MKVFNMILSDDDNSEINKMLGDSRVPHLALLKGLERFVCMLYQNKSPTMNTNDLINSTSQTYCRYNGLSE